LSHLLLNSYEQTNHPQKNCSTRWTLGTDVRWCIVEFQLKVIILTTRYRKILKNSFLALVAISFVLAFAFQGTRGIWEPDEGFYISAARTMVETGDWLVPQLNLRPFIDKPPIVFWGSALGMEVFGFNEWAARLSHAVWYLLTILMVGLIGKTLWDPKTGFVAALIYSTSLIPLAAANIVTPDTPLTFWVTAAMFFFWKSMTSDQFGRFSPWKLALGISLGMGVLCKGPMILVFLPPMAFFVFRMHRVKQFLLRWDTLIGLLLFVAICVSWYVALHRVIPGAIAYLLDNQFLGRLVTERDNRNSGFIAPLFIYLPVLVFGTLPWSVAWYFPFFKNTPRVGGWRTLLRLPHDPKHLFLLVWIVLPLIVFAMTQPCRPLYILPLFAPLAIVSARCWLQWVPAWFESTLGSRKWLPVAIWVLVLLTAKGGMAYWPTDRDTRAFWEGIRENLPADKYELVVVNSDRHGLSFYSPGPVEWVTTNPEPYPFFFPQETLEEEVHEIPTSAFCHVFIVGGPDYEKVNTLIKSKAPSIRETEAPSGNRLLITEPFPRDEYIVRLAAMGDTRTGDSRQTQLGSALSQVDQTAPLDGVILLGDNISYYGDPALFEKSFARPYHSLIRDGVRFFAVLGNHDITGGFASFQLNHFLFNMDGHRYYTRIFGGNLVQVFFLDSNTIFGDRVQRRWLIRELSKSTAAWKVVAMHSPIYGVIRRRPTPNFNLRRLMEPILIEGGVRIFLAGHNHIYQRLKPRSGIHYFTAGSGGKLDRGQLMPDDPDLVAGEDQTNVALILEFRENECLFRAIDMLEQSVDSGTIPRE